VLNGLLNDNGFAKIYIIEFLML